MANITLYNSRTRRKERFEPLDPKNVRMYVCGPTVYDRAHIGNARPAIVFDMLYRLLRHEYGAEHVTYVRNITDVEDKIMERAAERGIAIADLTRETTGWYHADMAALGMDYADDPQFREPHATDYIGEMIAMIARLIEGGFAYAREGHVLFRVKAYAEYGALSGRSVDDMIAGARVEVAPYKEDPMDFVLWKPSDPDQPGWGSPWGRGRPGWHIECSAMSHAILGESFDIHGGGADLTFPHHENEVAQSRCAHPEGEFARVWMHNEMLQVEGRKMSKSLGNFFTVRDLLDQGVPGEVIRFVFLSTHYRKPMDWTEAKRRDAEAVLRKWYRVAGEGAPGAVPQPVIAALSDDLNTHGALTEAHRIAAEGDGPGLRATLALLGLMGAAVPDWAAEGCGPLAALAEKLVSLRAAAMDSKDFSEVDRMKAALVDAGVEVRMSKAGVELLPAEGYDPAKLEAIR